MVEFGSWCSNDQNSHIQWSHAIYVWYGGANHSGLALAFNKGGAPEENKGSWCMFISGYSLSPEEQEVKEITKLLLEMTPLWTTFLVYGLVVFTGKTYFIDLASNHIPESEFLLFAIKSFSSLIINIIFVMGGSKMNGCHAGESWNWNGFMVLCCTTAWKVETWTLQIEFGQERGTAKQLPWASIGWFHNSTC